jgi:hypothetical protein
VVEPLLMTYSFFLLDPPETAAREMGTLCQVVEERSQKRSDRFGFRVERADVDPLGASRGGSIP